MDGQRMIGKVHWLNKAECLIEVLCESAIKDHARGLSCDAASHRICGQLPNFLLQHKPCLAD